MQYAFVVNDLDEAMASWSQIMGAGPFFVSREYLGNELTYRGQPSQTRVDYAFGQAGPVQVQLIAQSDPGPSLYRDMYPPGEAGFHHVGVLIPAEQMPAEVDRMQAAGYPVVASLFTSVPVAYFDCRDRIGCFVELYGTNQRTLDFFQLIADTHRDWDGTGPSVIDRGRGSSR